MAKGQSSVQSRLPMVCRNEMLFSWSAECQSHRKQVKYKTKKWFELSPGCQRLQRIDPSIPSSRFRGIPKAWSAGKCPYSFS